MGYQRLTVPVDANSIQGRPYFVAPEEKYTPEVRAILGIELWKRGDRTHIGTKDFIVPLIGVTLKVTEEKTRTLKLLCSSRSIDSAISNLPGKRLYGQEILDAFLLRGYPNEP